MAQQMHGYGLYLNVLILLTTSSYLLRYDDHFLLSERQLYNKSLTMCLQIGPPNPTFLKSTDKSTWEAKDVADSVLSDKSALVIY